MKAQSSFELLTTFGVVLAFTVPVLFLLLSFTSIGYEDASKAQADASARTLADTMNSVYAQGAGAQREILLNVPVSTEDIYASDGEIVVRIKTNNGDFDAVAPTIARISASNYSLGKHTGLFKVTVLAVPATSGDQVEVKIYAPAK
ncbi:Uncharacterised protein [Candidatus Bilamarchaeum dharawalense]|uniref:Uncharacterized protein n=1 Tax=Candidatus Bilamarchaeum dharawalense TaxID=2885759 RepID=A0A5E4LRN1_9ARCH|nr:Uncharacterised protein [Candidatus Bilamarchaeum dharawalense]